MGVYNNELITSTDVSTRIGGITAFFNTPLSGVTAETVPYSYNDVTYSGTKITINETNIEAFFGHKTDDASYQIVYVKKDDIFYIPVTATQNGTSSDAENIVLYSYLDAKCIWMSLVQKNRNGFVIAYVKTSDDRYLIGYKRSTTNDEPYTEDISSLIFEDAASIARYEYTYTNMFPFNATSGSIDFLNEAYFVNGNNVKSYTTDILKECSTTSLLSTASLTSPLGNHLSIGAHCIVPLDEDTEEVSE